MTTHNIGYMPAEGTSLIETALRIAVHAHSGQHRKNGNTPFIEHPLGVAAILIEHGQHANVIATGLLHDVIEDTGWTAGDNPASMRFRTAGRMPGHADGLAVPWPVRHAGMPARLHAALPAVRTMSRRAFGGCHQRLDPGSNRLINCHWLPTYGPVQQLPISDIRTRNVPDSCQIATQGVEFPSISEREVHLQ